MSTAAVILNFNDADTTLEAVRRIHDFSCLEHIVVVDNASTDNSTEVLKSGLADGFHKVTLLKNKKNGGYGYGNNRGVRFAREKLGAELVLIANPDAEFDEILVMEMQKTFAELPDTAAVGAVMNEPERSSAAKDAEYYRRLKLSGWMYRGFFKELLHSGPVMKRIFAGILDLSQEYYESFPERVPVYAVHGSLLMVSAGKFLKTGGYDESIFLYMEEYVLAKKFDTAGYKTYLIKKGYDHPGSHSITGAGYGSVSRQRMRQASELIYYKKYLGVGRAQLFFAKLFQTIVLLETKVWMRQSCH